MFDLTELIHMPRNGIPRSILRLPMNAASSKNLRLTSGGFCAVGSQVLCHSRPGATTPLFFPPRSCIRSQNFKAVHRIEQSVSFLLRATVILRKHQLPLVNCRLCRLNPLLNLRPITFQQSGFVRIVPAIVSRHNAPHREQAAQAAVNRYQSIVITEQGIWVKPVITVRSVLCLTYNTLVSGRTKRDDLRLLSGGSQ
jgi:hypothetical protein